MPEDGLHEWNVSYIDKTDKTLLWLMAGHMSILTGWCSTNYTKPLCILFVHILVHFFITVTYIYVF